MSTRKGCVPCTGRLFDMKAQYEMLKFLLADYAGHKCSRAMFAGILVDMLHKTEKQFQDGELTAIEKGDIFVNILHHMALIMGDKRTFFPLWHRLNSHRAMLQASPALVLNGITFMDMAIPYIQLSGCILKNVDFTGAVIPRLVLKNCNLIDCKLNEGILRNSLWEDCSLTSCSLDSTVLSSSTWHNCHLLACTYHNANLVSASFKISRLIGCAFDQQPDRASDRQTSEESDMTDSLWTECVLETCTFQGSTLLGSKFKKTKFLSTTFEMANTTGAQGVL